MTRVDHSGRLPVAFGYAGVLFCLILAVFSGLFFGDVKLTVPTLFEMLSLGPGARPEEAIAYDVVWRIRLPRVLSALMSGAILASCGVIFQAVLHNPLAEPYTLGVAGGAAFGAACAISFGAVGVTAASFAGSMGTLFVVWLLGERRGDSDRSRLILAGVIVGSILGAGLTLLKALAGERTLAIVVWLMGSFSDANWLDCPPLSIALSVLVLICSIYVNEMDIMASGTEGSALGLNVHKTRMFLLGGASLAVSFVVSRFGIIGFVGLVVPHLLRILLGPTHHRLLPLSFFGGAALLTAADAAAKALNELPVGVLTALVGGPIFCFILWRRN
ncbi:MAG: iron ABC transporter permease [Synergistaceae bacterium]|jgi:iron complex transport system permease protein|nr:iron ABC transporter permease [Synergistaceae bacterium]